MNAVFNPDLLKTARQSKGLSQTALADLVQVTQAAISKIEAALLQPSEELVLALGKALGVPASFFYEPDRVLGLPLSVQYRKRASVGQRALEQLEAEVNLRLFQLRRLLRSVDVTTELPLPEWDPDEVSGGAEQIAALLRRAWMVPRGPIRNLIDYVERAGIVVIHSDLQSLGVDGLTYRVSGLPVCVFLNAAMPGDRQRFTLAHELGHIVMHRLPAPEMERQADQFAAEFLMPAADIKSAFSMGLTIARLAELKPFWRVAMSALLYRAKTLGAISESQSLSLWKQMSRLGYRTVEPASVAIAPERGRVFDDIVQAHVQQLGFSRAELAKALHADEMAIVHLLGTRETKAGLRLVHSQ